MLNEWVWRQRDLTVPAVGMKWTELRQNHIIMILLLQCSCVVECQSFCLYSIRWGAILTDILLAFLRISQLNKPKKKKHIEAYSDIAVMAFALASTRTTKCRTVVAVHFNILSVVNFKWFTKELAHFKKQEVAMFISGLSQYYFHLCSYLSAAIKIRFMCKRHISMLKQCFFFIKLNI